MRAKSAGRGDRPRGLQRRVITSLQSSKSSLARPRSGWRIRVRSIMSVDDGVTRWLRQLEAGDQDAARLLWQRYYRELVELARARLGPSPRRVGAEGDVALSVFRCLGEGAAGGQFAAVVNRQELWQLLAT